MIFLDDDFLISTNSELKLAKANTLLENSRSQIQWPLNLLIGCELTQIGELQNEVEVGDGTKSFTYFKMNQPATDAGQYA